MNTIILTSKLNLYGKDEFGIRHAQNFGNLNGIYDVLKSKVIRHKNLLYIASVDVNIAETDQYAYVSFLSFEKTMPFENYNILDARSEEDAQELIKNADLIYLAGGHVPTQNKFFQRINLKSLLKHTSAPIIGCSSGSMNCEKSVWCPPELEGESLDPNFQKYYKGLGYTELKILPHYDSYGDTTLDGKHYLNEIVMPDTFDHDVLAINDGSYVVIENGISTVFGDAYILRDGKEIKICKTDESVEIKQENKNIVVL